MSQASKGVVSSQMDHRYEIMDYYPKSSSKKGPAICETVIL